MTPEESRIEELAQEVAELRRALTTVTACSRVLLGSESEAEILQRICRVIVEDCGYRLAWIGYKADDADRRVKPVAHAGFEEGYLETLNVTWADEERGRGPTGTAIRTGKVNIARNIPQDPRFTPWKAEALKRGFVSSIALPLTVVGGIFVAQKGVEVEGEVEAAQPAMKILGGHLKEVKEVHLPGLDAPRHLVVIEKVGPTPREYPRRAGVPAKRPLTQP